MYNFTSMATFYTSEIVYKTLCTCIHTLKLRDKQVSADMIQH